MQSLQMTASNVVDNQHLVVPLAKVVRSVRRDLRIRVVGAAVSAVKACRHEHRWISRPKMLWLVQDAQLQ